MIDPIKFGSIKGIQGISEPAASAAPEVQKGKGFGAMLTDALKEVDQLQKVADDKSTALTVGGDGVTPHDAMIALEKADVAFQLMSAVRNKIVRAYEEVMRTQV